jgi:hypothetical protein
MANQRWLDEVRERLARQALPPAYIRRFMEELSDHFQDITEETMGTEANAWSRLGESNEVAEAAVRAYRRRSFLGRHPTAAFLVFGVSPVVSQIVLFIVSLLGIRVVVMIADRLGAFSDRGKYVPPSPMAVEAMSYAFGLMFVIVPSILVGVLYCKLAKRSGIGKKWALISCTMLAAMAMLPCWYVAIKADAAGHALVVAGLWLPFLRGNWCGYCSNILELLELAIPVAIGWWFLRRKCDTRRESQPPLMT